MPRRYDDSIVHRRLSNGACIMDRQCCECGKEFVGERNICPTCRNAARRKSGKFGAEYHKAYYHKKYSKAAMRRKPGELTRKGPIADLRRAAFEKQLKRIRAEMKAIRKAGLDPDNDSVQDILDAGVVLEDCRFTLADLKIQGTADSTDYTDDILLTG